MSGATCAWAERDEIFEGYVRDALGPQDRDAFEAHYFECPTCFDKLQTCLALRVELGSSPAEAHAAGPARSRPWRWVLVPLAGTLAAVVAAALWISRPPLPLSPSIVSDAPPATAAETPSMPIGIPAAPALPPAGEAARPRPAVRNSAPASSSIVVLVPAENETRQPDALAFRWQGVPGAVYYEVHVVTEEGNVVWTGKAEGTSAPLPRDHALVAGTRYFVWVRAYLSGGGTVKSPAVSFRVGGL